MEFIGLDYHKQYTVATKIGPDGRKDQCQLYNTPDEFSRYFESEEETSVVFESSRGWPLLYEMIREKVDHIDPPLFSVSGIMRELKMFIRLFLMYSGS